MRGSVGSRLVACATLLSALNLLICYRLFALDASAAVFSTDAIYISISRYVLNHWRDLSWWPIWYGGVPGSTVYPPLLHALTALLAATEHAGVPLAHHQLAGVGYALGPVTLLLLAWRLSGSLATACGTGLCYTLLSPATWIVPWARADVGGVFRPFRLHVLLAYGDAPHVFALALLPLSIWALDVALERKTWRSAFVAVLAMASVALTNWVGSVALAVAVFAYLLARGFDGWQRAAGISLAAYAFSSPFLSPGNMRLVSLNSQTKSGSAAHLLEYALLAALALAGAKVLLRRQAAPRILQFAVFFLIFPGSLPLVLFWFGIAVIPEPHRYLYEMEMAICLLLGMVAVPLLRRSRVLIGAAGVLAVWLGVVCFYYAQTLIRPADLTNSMEYKTAMWFKDHADGARVYARGTVSWWLNAYTDVPQLGGGVSAAIPSQEIFTADDTLSGKDSDPDGTRTLQWLRAYGVDYAAVGPMVTQQYVHPERFDRIAEKVWAYGDDFIYRIPRRSRSLAHVIPRAANDLSVYVAAIENPAAPDAGFTWINAHEARVTAVVPAGDVVSIQISYAAGWHATVNGAPRPVTKDGRGLMVVDPQTSGPCIVELTFGRSTESTLTGLAAIAVLVFFIVASIREIIGPYGDPPVRAPQ